MKKYAAALLTVLAVVALGWAAVLTMRMAPVRAVARTSVQPIQAVQADQDALRRIHNFEQTLSRIERLKRVPALALEAPLAPSPAAPLTASAPSRPGDIKTGRVPSAIPVITLVYVSQDMKKAVINGKPLGIGDPMPNGGRIVEISQDEVVVELRGRRKTLQVPKPQFLGTVSKPNA